MDLDDCPPMATWLEPAEYLGNAGEGYLHVVSPHPYNRVHSQFAQSDVADELNIEGREFVRINTRDAESRGIQDGDLVELSNERGAVIAGARLSDEIMPGVVSLHEGAWVSFDSMGRCNSGAINMLTSSRASSQLSQATTANTCLALLKKAENIDGPNRAYDAPVIDDKARTLSASTFGLERIGTTESFLEEMETGEKLFYEKCTLCHVPKDPAAYTQREWTGITDSMFPNAGVNESERKEILDWLMANAKDS